MIDKLDLRIPPTAPFVSDFRFVEREVKFAGICGTVSRAKHYQGVIDLRPFGIDGMLHAYKRRDPKAHKFELFETGRKTLDEMAELVTRVFEVDPQQLEIMRVDLAADISDVTVEQMRTSLRVRFKRSIDERGELEYANVGGRQVGYFRYGKSPNCVRVYDKPAECRARLHDILKRCNPDAEPPIFDELFGFSEHAVLTRIERQCGGNRIPPELTRFRDLPKAARLNPFTNVEITPEDFPFPSVDEYGVSERAKLIGIAALVSRVGAQQARSELNRDGNGKRHWQAYEDHLRRYGHVRALSIEQVIEAFQRSTEPQLQSNKAVDMCEGGTHNSSRHEITEEHTRVLPGTGTDWRNEAQGQAHA